MARPMDAPLIFPTGSPHARRRPTTPPRSTSCTRRPNASCRASRTSSSRTSWRTGAARASTSPPTRSSCSTGDRIVAEAELFKGRRAEVHGPPGRQGPRHRHGAAGLDTAPWRARSGRRIVGQTVPDADESARDSSAPMATSPMWTSWVLSLSDRGPAGRSPSCPRATRSAPSSSAATTARSTTWWSGRSANGPTATRTPTRTGARRWRRTGSIPRCRCVIVRDGAIVGDGEPSIPAARPRAGCTSSRWRGSTGDRAWDARCCSRSFVLFHARGKALGGTLHGLAHRRARAVRARRDARRAELHASREAAVSRPRAAVAQGFEPWRELPPYTLSRRVPSAARAGHRGQILRKRGGATGRAAGRPAHGGGGAIRTRERRIRPLTAFEAVPFVHSGTPPSPSLASGLRPPLAWDDAARTLACEGGRSGVDAKQHWKRYRCSPACQARERERVARWADEIDEPAGYPPRRSRVTFAARVLRAPGGHGRGPQGRRSTSPTSARATSSARSPLVEHDRRTATVIATTPVRAIVMHSARVRGDARRDAHGRPARSRPRSANAWARTQGRRVGLTAQRRSRKNARSTSAALRRQHARRQLGTVVQPRFLHAGCPSDPANPAFGSAAPNTTRSMRATPPRRRTSRTAPA